MKTTKKLGWIVCALLLAVIVGCQPVGGLNLNGVLLKQLDVVDRQEQSLTFELELDVKEDLLALEDEETKKWVELLKKTKLEISHYKVDGKGAQWATGTLTTAKGAVPFTLHAVNRTLRIDVGGAKRPLVVPLPDWQRTLDLALLESHYGLGTVTGAESSETVQPTFTDALRNLMKNVAPFFVERLPNPPVIAVDRVNESIHGVPTGLTKVHAELNGEQLGQLVPEYVNNLLADKVAIQKVVVDVLRWASELPPELKGLFSIDELIDNETDAEWFAEEIVNEIYPDLLEMKEELKEFQKTEEWKEVFDKGIELKTDLYVDDSLLVRKSSLEAIIAPAAFAKENSPIRSVKLRVTGEKWNVNGTVDIPAVVIPANALTAEELDEFEPYRFVRLFEEDSVIYDLLKNEFEIDDQNFELSSEWGIPFYVDDGGVAYVPLRETLRRFGIRPNLHEAAKGPLEIRFYDEPTHKSITLRKGSDKATVNGQAVKLDHPLVNEANITYVSANDLFGLLGAEYEVTETTYGDLVMQVTRDL